MEDDSIHRRAMIELAQPHLTEHVLVADIFQPPSSGPSPGGGALGIIGLMLAWRRVNRSAGLPASVLMALTSEAVYSFKVERSLSGWTVRFRLRHWERGHFPFVSSTPNPAAITIDFDGREICMTSCVGSGLVASELVAMLGDFRLAE